MLVSTGSSVIQAKAESFLSGGGGMIHIWPGKQEHICPIHHPYPESDSFYRDGEIGDMEKERISVAQLDERQLSRVQSLEDELGVTIVAYEPRPAFARLNEEQLHRINEVEQELGTILIAYENGQ